ncbi:MAG: TonB-dependent receptor [Bacteroidota bacterium]
MKQCNFYRPSFLFLVIFLITTVALAQTGTLEGTVWDPFGNSLSSATVEISGTTIGSSSDIDGKYQIANVPVGSQVAIIRFVGYKPVSKTIDIQSGQTTRLEVTLLEAAYLNEIVVVGDAFSETDGFRARQVSTATRFPVNVLKLPNTVRVLPQELFRETRATLPQEATRYVSSVQQLPGFGDNAGFVIRGFFANYEILRNGVRGDNPGDLYNIERIEVLKGPIGSLYGGTGAFAGNVNVITKRPLKKFGGEITAFGGSNDFYRLQGDIGGPVSEDGSLRYRLNAVAENTGSFREFFDSEKYAGAGSIEWEPSEQTVVRLDASYLRRIYTFEEGLPLLDGSLASGLTTFDLPISRTFVDEDSEPAREGKVNIGIEAEHRFTEGLSLRVAGLYTDYSIDIGSSRVALDVQPDGRTVNRRTFEGPQSQRWYTAQADLIYKTDKIGKETVFLLGYEHFDNRYEYDAESRTLGTLDLITGERNPPPAGGLAPAFSGFSAYTGNAVYAQVFSQVTDRIALLAGLRQDWQNNSGEFNGEGEPISGDQLSPRFGATYAITTSTRLFANYGTSFTPNFALNIDGDVFDSDQVRQIEIGLRQELFNNKALFTLAAFDIVRSNVVIPDPNEFFRQIAAGRQSSRGIEFDFTGRVLPGLETILTYAYNHTEVTEEDDPNFGQTLAAAPEHSASIFVRYAFGGDPDKGLSVNTGLVYNSDIEASLPSSIVIPAAARLDFGIAYALEKLRIGLNVNNVLDEKLYVTNLFALFPQAPRTAVLTLGYRFGK